MRLPRVSDDFNQSARIRHTHTHTMSSLANGVKWPRCRRDCSNWQWQDYFVCLAGHAPHKCVRDDWLRYADDAQPMLLGNPCYPPAMDLLHSSSLPPESSLSRSNRNAPSLGKSSLLQNNTILTNFDTVQTLAFAIPLSMVVPQKVLKFVTYSAELKLSSQLRVVSLTCSRLKRLTCAA